MWRETEFKRKCEVAGSYCLATAKVEGWGNHFRIMLNQITSKEWGRIERRKVCTRKRRVG